MARLVLPIPENQGGALAPPTGWGHLAKWDPNALKNLLARLQPAARPAAPVPVAAPKLSPQDEQARLIAAGIIDPQTAAINRAIALKESDRAATAEASKGIIAALGNLTAGAPGSVRDAYSRAGTETMGFANDLTGAVGDSAQAAAAEAARQISSLGAPGEIHSDSPAAMNTLRYTGGYLPASNLAAEAASRLTEATTLRNAGATSLGQQALQQLNATNTEIADLRAKGLDIENTRPSEVAKALQGLRAQDLEERGMKINEQQAATQTRAEKVQEGALDRSWYQSLADEAWNRTNATGTLWTVRNGKIVNTGKPAPGSAAGRAATQAGVTLAGQAAADRRAAASLAERNAHNRVTEGAAAARLDLSKQQLKIAQDREARLGRAKTDKKGFSASDKRQFGKDAGAIADAAIHPKYADDPIPTATETLKKMIARGIPYSIAWNAVHQYASMPGSPWEGDLSNIESWYTPPKKK